MTVPSLFVESLVDGVAVGGIYAVIAIGLSMIYGVAGVLNLAHGDMVMLAGLLAISLSTLFLHLSIGLLLAGLVLFPSFFILGLALYMCLIKPVVKKSPSNLLQSAILTTLGISFIIQETAANILGRLPRGLFLGVEPVSIGQIVVPFFRIITLILVAVITIALWAYLKWTFLGKAMRAVAYNLEMSTLLGIPVDKVAAITFGIGSMLAALGGLLYVGNGFPITPYIGLTLTVKALTVIVIGGAGNLLGAFIGAIILGIAENLTGVFISFYWSPALTIVLLLTILMIKPRGLLEE